MLVTNRMSLFGNTGRTDWSLALLQAMIASQGAQGVRELASNVCEATTFASSIGAILGK